MAARFGDRSEAGHRLAQDLAACAGRREVLVLALPRGRVPVGVAVAHTLGSPLDVFLVRKLDVAGHEEPAVGVLASGGTQVLNQEVVDALRIPEQVIDAVAAQEQQELERREHAYRVGLRYRGFSQTSDEEVGEPLALAAQDAGGAAHGGSTPPQST